MKSALLLLCLLPIYTAAQSRTAEDPCDKAVSFCWYGPYKDGSDEVQAWGKRWFAKEQDKTLDFSTAFRCIKRRGVCIKAENVTFSGGTILRIEILPVMSWTSEQVNAEGETAQREPCDRESYIINRVDRTVLMISSPGPEADKPSCKGILGAPKTIVYRLMQ
jgi:hypothetical protein